jgi:hypothetical protein
MAQTCLCIDDATQAKLREAAAQRKVSQSQFVAHLIRRGTEDTWPPEALGLVCSVPDFPLAEELRAGLPPDAERDFG